MCIERARLLIKRGNGKPTIPTSNDHTDGTWLVTDIYVGEQYMDLDTGVIYTRDANDDIIGENVFKLSLTANELKSLNSSPIQENILPVGNCISSEVFIRFNTGTEEFNFSGNILLSFGTTSTIISSATVNNLVAIASSKTGVTNLYIKIDWTKDLDPVNGLVPDGRTFMIKALSGDATLGDSTMDIVVKYRTIKFD